MREILTKLWGILEGAAAAIIVLTTVGGFILLFFSRTREWLLSTLLRKRREYEKLSKLSPEVQIGFFESLLGVAVFKSTSPNSQLDEHIFVNRFYFVQAIANRAGRVLAYTVTLRNPKFNPQLWGRGLPSGSASVVGTRLGEVTFADFAPAQNVGGVIADLGGRRWHYLESYFFGNPGLYQSYYIGINDAGSSDAATRDVIHLLENGGKFGDLANSSTTEELIGFLGTLESQRFRSNARPNMYGVASQDGFELFRDRPMGPDRDKVRVLVS